MLNSWHACIMGEFSLIVNDTNICITHIYILEICFRFFSVLYVGKKLYYNALYKIIYAYLTPVNRGTCLPKNESM